MAEASCPRASRYVFRLRRRFGSGHQGGRSCGGLYRQDLASPLLTYMAFKSRCARLCLEAGREGPAGEKGHKASDSVGTLHFSHWVPFENNHMGFFTIYDGDFEKYIQDFADKTSFAFDALFPHIIGAPPTPVAKNAKAFISGHRKTTIRPSGFTAPIQASRFKTFEPCWPTASHNRPPLDSRCGTTINEELRAGKAKKTQGETR